jgi:hypothetical protein
VLAVLVARAARGHGRGRGLLRDGGLAVAAGLTTWAAAIGFFVWCAGAQSVIGDGQLLLRGLSPETKYFLTQYSGILHWRRGLVLLALSAALWGFAYLVAEAASLGGIDTVRTRARRRWLAAAIAILAVGLTSPPGDLRAALLSAAPLLCLAAFLIGMLRLRGRRAAAFAAYGLLGFALSFRRVFDIRDSGYVAPPLLFAVVCAAGLLRIAVVRERRRCARSRLAAGLQVAVLLVIAFWFGDRAIHYLRDDRVAIGGTGGLLSATAPRAAEIEALAAAVREGSRPGDGLVVIPEGAVLNLLSGRSNPIREKLLIPGYLTDRNEERVLRSLQSTRPEAIVVWEGPEAMYGSGGFGVDYGCRIERWIGEHYRERGFSGRDPSVLRRRTTLLSREADR